MELQLPLIKRTLIFKQNSDYYQKQGIFRLYFLERSVHPSELCPFQVEPPYYAPFSGGLG